MRDTPSEEPPAATAVATGRSSGFLSSFVSSWSKKTYLGIPLYFRLPIMEFIILLGLIILALGNSRRKRNVMHRDLFASLSSLCFATGLYFFTDSRLFPLPSLTISVANSHSQE